MVDFTDPRAPVDLAPGIRLRAPGLRGSADVHAPAPGGTRSASIEDPTDALTAALAATGMREQALVTLDVQPLPGAGGGGGGGTRGRGDAGQDQVVLDVPQPDGDVGQALMAIHEGGVISWHLPHVAPAGPGGAGGGSGGRRGAGASVQYRIELPELGPPVDELARDEDADTGTRGLMGLAGRVLLKALVFPVAREVAGRVGARVVRGWEANHRPYDLRWFGPSDDPRAGTSIDSAGLGELARDRALLLVHGTFSTSQTGFGQLPDRVVGQLASAYGGRVFTFEHPSVASSVDDNIGWLRERLAGAPHLDVDVVTHSRGGLVGRVLAGGVDPVPEVSVNTLVFGATPNHGTLLADPNHVVAFLDRATTLLNLAPPGPADVVQTAMEGVLVGVKAIVAGGLAHLTGLTGMDPTSPWLTTLNQRPVSAPPTLRAIAANFEPTGALRKSLKLRVQDEVVDRIMGDAHNDTVVPTAGVSGSADDPASLVRDPLVFATGDGVHHSNLFAKAGTHDALLEWLVGGTDVA